MKNGPSGEETTAAELAGSHQLFEVAERYDITGGVIVPTGDLARRRFYHPFAYPELPGRLADVHDEASVLGFANKWGLLGYAKLRQSGVSVDQLKRTREDLNLSGWGDPIDWILAHAGTVKMIIEMLDLLKRANDSSIDSYLDSAMTEPGGATINHASGTRPHVQMAVFASVTNPREAAARLVSMAINSNLIGVSTQLLVFDDPSPGTIVHSRRFLALAPAIYSLLADLAVGYRDYFQCAYRHCGKWWPTSEQRRGPKRRYCPPDVESTESLCGRLERHYAQQDRQRGVTRRRSPK